MSTRHYDSPEITFVEINSEGVLCGSTASGTNETWGNGNTVEWDD